MPVNFFNPCIKASGPSNARIAFVGEAPGEQEELIGLPFVGKSGQEFTSILQEVGIERSSCYLTNVLWSRPPGNKLETFLISKKDCPPGYSLPPVKQGFYLHPSLLPELERLQRELETLQPNLIVALGNTATWALLGSGKITSARGAISKSSLCPGLKVFPTYHPAAVLRNWSWRVVVLQDLIKAKREAEFPEIRRVERRILIDPDWTIIRDFIPHALAAKILSVDIETERRQITSISFSPDPSYSLVIPFWDKRKPDYSFWSLHNESLIWSFVDQILSKHKCVLFQNGLYDTQYIWKMGIAVPGFTEDTMLLHHSLYPELPKSLEFLGSIYSNELSWKHMRTRHGAQETKRDE